MPDDQQGQLEHMGQAGAFRRQGNLQVGQCLTRLLGELGRQLPVAAFPALAGDEQQAAVGTNLGDMGIGIAAGVIQAFGIAQLKRG